MFFIPIAVNTYSCDASFYLHLSYRLNADEVSTDSEALWFSQTLGCKGWELVVPSTGWRKEILPEALADVSSEAAEQWGDDPAAPWSHSNNKANLKCCYSSARMHVFKTRGFICPKKV